MAAPREESSPGTAEIRKIVGRRLILQTDLPSSPEIDRLPQNFEQAFPQWCAYFHVDPARYPHWCMTACLMKDKALFERSWTAAARPAAFQARLRRGYHLWLYEQSTDYYRRHLLLHEGTHGFMFTTLGSCGPPWYMEGTAELMGTHRLEDGHLTLNVMPADREEVPGWGRIRIIKDAFAERRAMRFTGVIDYPPNAHVVTEPYAWCWAAVILLDRHPRYRQPFHELYKYVLDSDFNDRFRRRFARDWAQLCVEWQVMTSGLEYGYDIERTAIDFAPGHSLPVEGTTVRVAADRGWQNSGLRLEAGSITLTAAGRYQVGRAAGVMVRAGRDFDPLLPRPSVGRAVGRLQPTPKDPSRVSAF